MTRTGNPIADALTHWLRREHEATLRVLRAFAGQHLDYKPHPSSGPAGEIARHLVASQRGFIARLKGETPPPFEMPDAWPHLLEACERFFRAGVRHVESLGDDGLAATAHVEGRSRVRMEVILEMAAHEIHHRTQLASYLRLLDLPIPEIYGPSADTGEKMA